MSESRGMINVYTCSKGHETVTLNLDDGTTPFLIGCKFPCCIEVAYSAFYRVDQGGTKRPMYVWEKINPTHDECLAMLKKEHKAKDWTDEQWDTVTEETLEYYRQGGLHLRHV